MTIGYVTIRKFCELTGYTEKAIRAKIYKGDWLENRVWRKAPDGHILISMEGFWLWVETGMVSKKGSGETEFEKRQQHRTKSPSSIGVLAARKRSSSSPRPLILTSPSLPTDEDAIRKGKDERK